MACADSKAVDAEVSREVSLGRGRENGFTGGECVLGGEASMRVTVL